MYLATMFGGLRPHYVVAAILCRHCQAWLVTVLGIEEKIQLFSVLTS